MEVGFRDYLHSPLIYVLMFKEGDPEKFTVGVLETPLRIASPFQVRYMLHTCGQKWADRANDVTTKMVIITSFDNHSRS